MMALSHLAGQQRSTGLQAHPRKPWGKDTTQDVTDLIIDQKGIRKHPAMVWVLVSPQGYIKSLSTSEGLGHTGTVFIHTVGVL